MLKQGWGNAALPALPACLYSNPSAEPLLIGPPRYAGDGM